MGKCKIKGTATAVTLQKYNLEVEPGFFATPGFINNFGDWINTDIINEDDFAERVNEDGSPKLYINGAKTQLFYRDKGNNRISILQVKFSTLPVEERHITSAMIINDALYNLYSSELIGRDGVFVDKAEATATLSAFFDTLIKEKKDEGVGEGIIESMVESKSDYIDAIKARLRSSGIVYEEDLTDYEEGDTGTNAIKQRPSYQRKASDKASSTIKLMLEALPAYDFNGDPIIIDGLVQLVNPSVAWGVLLSSFANIPNKLDLHTNEDFIHLDRHEGVNMVEEFQRILNGIAESHPWLNTLIDYIEYADDATKLAFFASFNNVKNKIYTATTTGEGVTIMSTEDSGGDSRFIMDSWASSAAAELFPNNSSIVVDNIYTKLHDSIEEAVNKINNIKVVNAENIDVYLAELADALKGPLDILGIPVTADALKIELGSQVKDINASMEEEIPEQVVLTNMISSYKKSIKGKNDKKGLLDLNTPEEVKAHVKADYRELANATSKLQSSMSEHMATVGKNRVYLYSLPTVLQEQINELKENPAYVHELLKMPKYKNSKFLQALAVPGNLARLDAGLRGVLQERGNSKTAKDGKDIGPSDYAMVDMNSVLRMSGGFHKPLYNTQVPADKNREYILSMQFFEETNNVEEAADILIGYVQDEYQEMVQAKLDIQEAVKNATIKLPNGTNEEIYELASQSLRMGYHLDRAGRIGVMEDGVFKFTGSAFEFKILGSMHKNSPDLITAEGVPVASSVEGAASAFNGPAITMIRERANRAIENLIQEATTNFEDAGGKLFAIGEGDSAILHGGAFINTDITNHYKEKYKEQEDNVSLAKDAIFRDYVLNSVLSKIEYAKVFTGSLQYYKHNSDYIKRVPSTYIDGLQMVTGIKPGDTRFRQITFETEKFNSFLSSDDSLSPSIQAYYKSVDRTDAQGWITPKRWKNIMVGTGKFSANHAAVYNKLERQWAYVNNNEDIPSHLLLTDAEVKVLSFQPLKGVYFKNDYINGPTYLKYSQAVLIPSFVANLPKAKSLLKMMTDNNIDEAVADSGVKVGSKKSVTLDGGLSTNIIEAATSTLDNRNWRLQQDLPTKHTHPNKIGTQIQKIIISSLRFKGGLKGAQLADAIDASLTNLSNMGVATFMKKYGIKDDGTITNYEAFYKSTLRDMENEGVANHEMVSALQAEIPLAALPSISHKVIASFFAANKRAATNLMTSGGSFIQISDHLMTGMEMKKKGVKMLISDDTFDRLKPPLVKIINKKKTVIPGQVLIPHSIIAKYIPNYAEMSIEELNRKIPKDVLELIGYRIPTQSRASTEMLQVIGILPQEMGDSIIAYGEITAKTGSDFDIDKLFYMMPEIEATLPASTYEGARNFLSFMNLSEQKMRDVLVDEYELNEEDVSYLHNGKLKPLTKDSLRNLFIKTVLFSDNKNQYKKYFNQYKGSTEGVTLSVATKGVKGAKNKVFNLFKQALTDPELYQDLMTSIDNDTTETMISSLLTKEAPYDLDIFSPVKAIRTRFMYKAGQAGIGEMVNANNDHIRSQGLGITAELGLGTLANLTMDEQFSKPLEQDDLSALLDHINEWRVANDMSEMTEEEANNRKITDILSELTNAFVDIANKDAFITKANWGSLMNSYGTMLIRAGVHPGVVAVILKQPGVTETVRGIAKGEGLISNSSSRQIRASIIKKYKDLLKEKYEEGFIQVKDIDNLSQIDLSMLIDLTAVDEASSYDEILAQVIILQHIDDTLDVTKQYTNNLTTSKTGEKGAGKSIGDLRTHGNKLDHSLAGNLGNGYYFKGLKNKYFNDAGEGTLLMSFYENTVGRLETIIAANPKMFSGMGKDIAQIFSEIHADNNAADYISSAEVYNKMQAAANMYLLSNFEPLNKKYSEEDTMRLNQEVYALKNENKYAFLDKLYIEGNSYVMNKVANLDNTAINTLMASWTRLLKDHPEVGEYLVHRAYEKNGFSTSPKGFAQLIPPMWLISKGIEGHILSENTIYSKEVFADQLFRNKMGSDIFTTTTSGQMDENGLYFVKKINGKFLNLDNMKNARPPKYSKTPSNIDEYTGLEEGRYGIKLLGMVKIPRYTAENVKYMSSEAVYAFAGSLPEDVTYFDRDEAEFASNIYTAKKEEELDDTWESIIVKNYKGRPYFTGSLENMYRSKDLNKVNLIEEMRLAAEYEAIKQAAIGKTDHQGQQSDIC